MALAAAVKDEEEEGVRGKENEGGCGKQGGATWKRNNPSSQVSYLFLLYWVNE